MTAIIILCLIGWAGWLTVRSADLKNRITRLERRVVEPRDLAEPTPRPLRTAAETAPTPTVRKRVVKVVPDAAPAPAPVLAKLPESPPPPRPKGPDPREQIAAWLSENGLAWMGGGVLALGGLFMVSYAAQRGFFTPPMRIVGAVALGAVLVGVSEWLKRVADRDTSGHRLAAAAAAGAGASSLYAATWASYWLYSFIGLGAAGALMGLIAFGLLALSLRHGQPLAILAVAGALLAPAITGPQRWEAPALTGYLALMVATGYGMAGARRWGQAGMVTLAGALLWAVAGYLAEGYVRVAALAVGPVGLSIAALEWRRRRAPDENRALAGTFNLMPTAAIVAAAVLVAGLWACPLKGADLAAAIVGSVLLMAFAAYAALRRLMPSILQLGVYGSSALVAVAFYEIPSSRDLELWGGVLALATAACGLWAALGAKDDRERLYAGGGALAAMIIAFAVRGPFTMQAPWAPPAIAAIVLGAGGWVLARRLTDPVKSLPLALWFWTSGSALLLALKLGSDPQVLTVAAALVAAGYALLHVRVGWRGFGSAAIAGGLASLGALLNPDLLRPLFAHHGSALALAAAGLVAAGVVFGASRVVHDKEQASPVSDALGTAALLIALTSAFLLLRYWGAMGTGSFRLDPFTEASLRTLLSLTAGLLSTLAVRESSHAIGRWRGHVLLGLGLVQALLFQLLIFNPLWGWWVPAVSGPPILDSLALGFLAPAVLLAGAASKRVTTERRLVAVYAAGALLFAVAWAVMETRRLFQGASLHVGIDHIGRAEVSAYALLGLLLARLLFLAAGRRGGSLGQISGLVLQVARGMMVAALAFAVVTYCDLASAWWGPIGRPLQSQGAAALLFAVYIAGAAVTVWLIFTVRAVGEALLSRLARLSAVVIVFALLNLITRWGFLGLDMRPNLQEASLQTWTFSAVWGLYGFGLLVFASARREPDLRWFGLAALLGTTAKVFLFDMARLEGIVRAGSFLAVGALLLAAAVIARRLSGGTFGLGAPKTLDPD